VTGARLVSRRDAAWLADILAAIDTIATQAVSE
jgi:hypothetical protein